MDRQVTEGALRDRFRDWLSGLDDGQVAVLAENWENVMYDAALDRISSWGIVGRTLAMLHADRKQATDG